MEEKYLPIGTVVMLKGGIKRVMIIGFCASEENSTDIYDYSGCLYPEGVLSSNALCMFNHDQIDKIYHMGLSDEEDVEFKKELNKILEQINKAK